MALRLEQKIALWTAVNRYSNACGGDPERVSGERMDAVVEVERVVLEIVNGIGPANDTPEVLVEIRAAELAEQHDWWSDPDHDPESYGALCYHNGGTPGADGDGGCSTFADDEQAGYLACVIAATETDEAAP